MLARLAHTSVMIWWIVTSFYESVVGIAGRAVTSLYMAFYLPASLPKLVHMIAGFSSSKNNNAHNTLSSWKLIQ